MAFASQWNKYTRAAICYNRAAYFCVRRGRQAEKFLGVGGNFRNLPGILVDLIGIEPMTSSMPWKFQSGILLTAKDL